MNKNKGQSTPKGLTKNERKAYIRRQKAKERYDRQFDADLAFCIEMETSRHFRDAWKTCTYLACKERN